MTRVEYLRSVGNIDDILKEHAMMHYAYSDASWDKAIKIGELNAAKACEFAIGKTPEELEDSYAIGHVLPMMEAVNAARKVSPLTHAQISRMFE